MTLHLRLLRGSHSRVESDLRDEEARDCGKGVGKEQDCIVTREAHFHHQDLQTLLWNPRTN